MEIPSLNPHRYDDMHLRLHSDTIKQIIVEITQHMKVKSSSKSYSDLLRSMDKLFDYRLLDYINDAEYIINIITDKYPKNPRNYVTALASIGTHSTTFKSLVVDDAHDIYHDFMIKSFRKDSLSDLIVVNWKVLIEKRKEFQKGTMEYVLYSLYTMLPPVRDNYGNVKIYQTYIHEDDSNQYITSTKQLIIKKYKTAKTYFTLTLNLPEKIYKEIDTSLELFPRKYLIVQPNGHPYANGKLSSTIKQWFDLSINNFRHSFASYIQNR